MGRAIGKYEVLTELPMGGMAELFLAFTKGPGGFRKYVVIKRMLPDVRSNEQFVRMFLDEARITAAFNHPNIAQVYELGEGSEGLYLAMEFISGQNLNQIVGACARRQAVLPIGFSVSVVRDVCDALHYAHTFTNPLGQPSPIIHRDVAQKNVMVTYEGVVKLLDFGIAKAKGSLSRTRVGTVKGTTGYMSPEQVRGEELDGRSDVFCAGVLIHELVTGRRLFAGDTELEEMKRILEAPIPRPDELEPVVPRAIADVAMRALSRERADRYQSARELARALERAAGSLLFDQEQRAGFMREQFAEKMSATRALLESAEGPASPALVSAAVRALRQDSVTHFREAQRSEDRERMAKQRVQAARRVEDERLVEESIRLELAAVSSAEPPPRRGGLWVLLGLAFLCLLAFLAYDALDKVRRPAPDVFGGPPPGLAPFEGELPPLPEFGAPRKGEPSPSAVPAAPQPEVAPKAPVEKSRAPKGTGTLTLITTPDATVVKGKTTLGKTPLFKLPLPAGTHLLTLLGDDGKKRALSVPVAAGKNTAFRVKLADLPER